MLGETHLCFFVHRAVEQFDLRRFEEAYGSEGRLAYPPVMMLKVWLYAFALGVSSTRRLERRIQEDLAFRYLAGGLAPDHKTLSEFLRRHRRAINEVFTQVVQMGRRSGMGKLGMWPLIRRECAPMRGGAGWCRWNSCSGSSGRKIVAWCVAFNKRQLRRTRRRMAVCA